MKMEYVGVGPCTLKYQGRMIPIKNGTKVDVDDETAQDLSKRKENGETQWTAAGKETPKKKQKGDS